MYSKLSKRVKGCTIPILADNKTPMFCGSIRRYADELEELDIEIRKPGSSIKPQEYQTRGIR
jgi:hypothetical protein